MAKHTIDVPTMINHASALNHLAKELIDRTSKWSVSSGLGSPPTGVSGAILGAIIVAPFSLELAIKALYIQRSNKVPRKSHNLVLLFMDLDCAITKLVEQRFSAMRVSRYPEHKYNCITINQVITDWRDSFEKWRYLAEGPLPVVKQLREGPILTDAILEIAREGLEKP